MIRYSALLLLLLFTSLRGAAQEAGDGMSSTYEMIPGQSVTAFSGEVVTYHLTVADTTVNFTGNPTPALATNGSIPAPVLAFTEGDSARIYVTNQTGGTVSFHWHGLLLPNEFDGVPLLNTELIQPGDTYVAAFPIIQHGTYWYHSHTEFQEQKGMYGPIVIQPKDGLPTREKVVVLSDFTEQDPHEVLRQIKRHTDWYAIKRNAVQSYGRALATGNLGKQLWLEWNRMPSMDLADVYYNAFLANGKLAEAYPDVQAGETLRLRIINGSASSHFWLQFAGGKMTIVAADGQEVEPVAVDKLLIATAETYDIEVTLPADGSYEFRATSWDRYRHTTVWLGTGSEHPAPDLPPVDYYALTQEMKEMMADMPDMQMGKAPSDIPPPRVYPAGMAPSNADIQMESMMKMGMQMDMEPPQPAPGMDHGKMDHGMPPTKQDNTPKPEMDHNMPGMDHGKMGHDQPAPNQDSLPQGRTISAREMDGKTMDMGSHMGADAPMGVMMTGYYELQEANPDEKIFDYHMLRSPVPTELHDNRPVRVVHLYLGGNMLRYVWMINNQPLSAADKIMIERGENVRFVFHNTTMMSHPMHLHGHFFRVVNKQGAYAPLKHTVNVAPMETTIIEFAATEDKDWFFHCHLLYHMMSGMARIIGYQGSSDLLIADQADYDMFAMDDRKYFGMGGLTALSNGAWADLAYFNLNKEFSLEGEADYQGNFEAEAKAMRYIDPRQFFSAYLGVEVDGEQRMAAETGSETLVTEVSALAGVRYFLPMMVWSDLRIDHRGRIEVQLEREDIPLTTRWRASAAGRYNFSHGELEYTLGTSYQIGQYWGLAALYDSDYGLGGGLKIIW
ncbi:FtsP/CotA-like multicopper oxidase with cupredoxin domain [Lewinella marina]|nr:multicopper oxidase domain-containing protein [Neolewinella marina]NJB86083.1 FtsP/CotA-like multicopper oxidase with cupredoxin domain [Neolewinella marina]